MTVVSVYVPNGGKDFPAKMRFLDALEQFAADMRADPNPIVICGDLNIARTDMDVHPKERKPRAIGQLPEERAQLERIIGHGLVDVGRALEPDNDQMFTWWAPWRNMRQRNIGWRLDYLLASQRAVRPRPRLPIERETGTSDHAPVVGEFDLILDDRISFRPDLIPSERPHSHHVKLIGDGHDDRHGLAVQQCRRELPLLDRVERGLDRARESTSARALPRRARRSPIRTSRITTPVTFAARAIGG